MLFEQLSKSEQIRRYAQLAQVAVNRYPIHNPELHYINHSNNIFFRVQTPREHYALRICHADYDVDGLIPI